jgi:hypothetical protein
MRKLIILLASILVLSALPISTAAAQSYHRYSAPLTVDGFVSANRKASKNTRVFVSCDGHTLTDHTNRQGWYSVTFKGYQCSQNSVVTAHASKNSKSGEASGRVGRCHNLRLNIRLITVNMPEFGAVEAIGAGVVSAAAFLIVRRNKLLSTTRRA